MTDKSKLKTRSPSSQFLEETKPPEFVPRARAKKNRAWYRPEDDEVETPPTIAAEPAPAMIVQAANPIASAPALPPTQLAPPVAAPPIAPKKPLRSAPPPQRTDSLEIVPQPAAIEVPPPPTVTLSEVEEEPASRAGRQGATAQALFEAPKPTKQANLTDVAEPDPFPLTLTTLSTRAQALIDRAKNGCPHEYLFRQILMFEMSAQDPSGDFGTLALSRNGLEQLFGISEGGVKKAKREMESYNLIATVSLGTRGSPTVFKIFSPYKAIDKLS